MNNQNKQTNKEPVPEEMNLQNGDAASPEQKLHSPSSDKPQVALSHDSEKVTQTDVVDEKNHAASQDDSEHTTETSKLDMATESGAAQSSDDSGSPKLTPKSNEQTSEDAEKQLEREKRRAARQARREAAEAGVGSGEVAGTDGSAPKPREKRNVERASAKGKRPRQTDGSVKKGGETGKAPKKAGVILDSPVEVLSTLGNDGKRRWMYPVLSGGRFWSFRRILAYTLLLLFFGLPLLPIDGKPAIFIDIAHGEFTFFGLTLLRTDLIILMLGVMTCLLSVVYITALFGRVWCGWGCPQTVYMEFVFRPLERLIEGKAGQRRRRDEKGKFSEKAWRKVLKYAVYLCVSLIMAHGFVAYFVSWPNLIRWMGGPPTEHWGFFVMMLITTSLIFFDFTYFREQMCTIACPYARIQSVLQDRHSMIVSFDPARGEPRGRRNRKLRKQEEEGIDIGLGDCIDCGACVRTCPTGIDIRNGLQMECIGCTQCIDACEAIMISVNKPVGLIRYTSENAIDRELMQMGRQPLYGKKENVVPPSVIRPRTIFYTIGLLILMSIFVTSIVRRTPIDVSTLRISKGTSPYTMVDRRTVANRVQFVLSNRTPEDQHFVIEPISPEGMTIRFPANQAIVKAGQSRKVDTFILAPKKSFKFGKAKALFKVTTVGHEGEYDMEEEFSLLGPD